MKLLPEFFRSTLFAFYAVVVLAAFSYIFSSFFVSRRRYSPSLPPGPRGAPILGYLPFLEADLLHVQFAKLAEVHGSVFSLQLGSMLGVVVSSASAARQILRDQDAIFANRDPPAAAHINSYDVSDIVWSPYGPLWRTLRKVVQEILSGHTLGGMFHKLRRREVRAMVRRVAERARAGKEVEVAKEVFLTVMGVVSSMLWGAGEGSEIVDVEFKGLVGEMMELVGTPNVSDYVPWLRRFDLQGIEKKMWVLRERFDGLYERVIAVKERSHGSCAGSGEAECFLDVMLPMEGTGGGDGKIYFTRSHTKAVMMDMIAASTDSTTNTVEFAMAEMMKRPETIRKAQAELDELVGGDGVVQESQAMNLPYLAAIVKEVLRLHPPAPLLVPHCPSADCVVGGYTVPAGSRVFVNAWAIHRDSTAWEDPFMFKPERFIGDHAAGFDFSGKGHTYIPFGSGRRTCIGKAMGERVVVYVLAALLHAFDWQLPDEEKEVNIEEKFGLS